jgi:hypothetical protein
VEECERVWGLIEDPDYEMRRLARDELLPHDMWVTGVAVEDRYKGNHKLTKRKGWKQRHKPHAVGSFSFCCRKALEIIEARK